MSTHNPLGPILDSLATDLLSFSSSLNALRCTIHDKAPQTKRQTRSQPIGQVAKQPKNATAELLATVLCGIDGLSGQLQAIILQATDAQARAKNLILPSNEQVMDEATNRPQMDNRLKTGVFIRQKRGSLKDVSLRA